MFHQIQITYAQNSTMPVVVLHFLPMKTKLQCTPSISFMFYAPLLVPMLSKPGSLPSSQPADIYSDLIHSTNHTLHENLLQVNKGTILTIDLF